MTRDLLSSLVAGSQARDARLANQANIDLQRAKLRNEVLAEQKAQAQNELSNLAVQGDSAAFNQLAALNPQRASQIQDFQTRQSVRSGQLAQAALNAPAPQRAAIYPRLLEQAASEGIDITGLPAQYSPEVEQQLKFISNAGRGIEQQIGQRQIMQTGQGIATIDPQTGEALPVTMGGERLTPFIKPPSTVVNVGAGEKEEQKELGKIRAKRYEAIQQSGQSAQRGLETLETLRQAVSNPDASQGAFADLKAESKKIANLFGVKIEGLEDDAVIAALGNKLALQLRSPKGEDGGLTGSTSDRDLSFLVAGVPNRNKTRSQNLALIDIGTRDKQRTVEIARLADQYLEEKGTMSGFGKVRRQFLQDNPLYPEGSQEKEAIKRALEGMSDQPSVQEGQIIQNPTTGERMILEGGQWRKM
jgi:hypothetical protein